MKAQIIKFFNDLVFILSYYEAETFKTFTNWLIEYKIRYYIKRYIRYNESNEINKIQLKKNLKKIRAEIKSWLKFEFLFNDVYNMNKTIFFWKAMFETILFSQLNLEIKTNKFKITANICCNIFEFHKLKLWFIDIA